MAGRPAGPVGSSQLAQLVRDARMEFGYTLAYVADAVGVSESYLSRFERGRTTQLPEAVAHRLSEVLKLDTNLVALLADVPRTKTSDDVDSAILRFAQAVADDTWLTADRKSVLVQLYRTWVADDLEARD